MKAELRSSSLVSEIELLLLSFFFLSFTFIVTSLFSLSFTVIVNRIEAKR